MRQRRGQVEQLDHRVIAPVAQRGVTRIEPVRAAHALSIRLVSFLDLCAGLAHGLRRSRARAAIGRCRPAAAHGHGSRSEARGDEDFAGLRAYAARRAAEAHGLEGAGARRRSRRCAVTSSLAAQPEWLDWSTLEGLDTEARLSQLCLWVLESDAAQRALWAADSRARRFAPSGGAAHRFACLRALAAFGDRVNRDDHRHASPTNNSWGSPPASRSRCSRTSATLPLWVLGDRGRARGGIRLLLARARTRRAARRRARHRRGARRSPLLFVRFHTFNGLSAGTALLAVMAGLKLLETQTQRDIYIITLIIYFVSLAALLEGDSFWLLAYLIGVCWLTTATLLRLDQQRPAPGLAPQSALRADAFWRRPCRSRWCSGCCFRDSPGPCGTSRTIAAVAASGLSDTMSPGDITQLALSDEVAFRVRFAAATPPPQRTLLARPGAA